MNSNDLSIKSYTDVRELNKLKQANRRDDPRALEAVAKQFESLFMNMLLQNMRQANEALSGDGLFDSSQSKFYQGMLDQQLGITLAEGKGIGLSEVLVRQLSPKGKTAPVDPAAPQPPQALQQMLDQAARSAVEARMQPASAAEGGAAVALQAEADSDGFASPEEFVAKLNPIAQRVAAEAGVDPRVLLAQAALETGWGQHMPRMSDGSSSRNLFGIKADQRWSGPSALVDTLEFKDGVAKQEKAAFRAYDSYAASMSDYLNFLRSSSRYQAALAQAGDSERYVEQLQLAGYASDPAYAKKITGILNGDVLQGALERLKQG